MVIAAAAWEGTPSAPEPAPHAMRGGHLPEGRGCDGAPGKREGPPPRGVAEKRAGGSRVGMARRHPGRGPPPPSPRRAGQAVLGHLPGGRGPLALTNQFLRTAP